METKTVTETLKDLSEQTVLDISARLGEPDWLRDARLEAYKAFVDLAWPTPQDEEWRQTSPKRIDLDRALGSGDVAASAHDTGVLERTEVVAAAIHLAGDAVASRYLSEDAAAAGVVVTDLATAAHEHADVLRTHLGAAVGADEKFDAANLAAFTVGALVYVPADVALNAPITVQVQGGADGAWLPRVVVVTGRHAQATVYVEHHGGGSMTVDEVIEADVGEGSRLRLVTAQDWEQSVDQVTTHRGRVGRDANYTHLELTFGGGTVYVRPDLHLAGEGAVGELLGVYFGAGEQHFEHRSLIHHDASHTTSDYLYKGALQDSSRAVWYGNIRIEPYAKATASDETNRNLILSDGARADSLPFLEILTSDVVRCGHHSSVGQVDEEHLFYLQSRGIPRPEAARMLVFGFFAEVTDRIDLPGVTEAALAEIARELRESPTALMDPRRAQSRAQRDDATPAPAG